jgi:hypothetical protein
MGGKPLLPETRVEMSSMLMCSPNEEPGLRSQRRSKSGCPTLVSRRRMGATKLARSPMLRVLVSALSETSSAGQPAAPQFWSGLVPITSSVASFQPSPSVSQGTPIAIEALKVESGAAVRLSGPMWPWLVRVRK